MNLLALDISNKTGWKTETASGVWNCAPKKDETAGMSLIRFKAKFLEVMEAEKIDIVSVERPAGRNQSSLISMAKKHGIVEEYCHAHSIQFTSYSSGEIKKFATGIGNCSKEDMIKACIEKLGYTPVDDNEADAIHLYYLTKEDLRLRVRRKRRVRNSKS